MPGFIAHAVSSAMLNKMDNETSASHTEVAAPGLKHWLLQTLPPLLMLGILPATGSGPSLVFVAGFLLLPVLISLISIIAKLIFFRKRKYFLARPVLTVAVFSLILFVAHWTYAAALRQTIDEARDIHQQCNRDGACPERPAGWRGEASRVRKSDLGPWLKYSASYHLDGDAFSIRLYQGPDLGDVIQGGVGLPFSVAPYQEK